MKVEMLSWAKKHKHDQKVLEARAGHKADRPSQSSGGTKAFHMLLRDFSPSNSESLAAEATLW